MFKMWGRDWKTYSNNFTDDGMWRILEIHITKSDGGRTMELKEFANLIDGRQYDYRMFTKEELQLAKDNRIVIVTGASDDLVELEGAITDEGDCWEGGKIYVKAIPNGGIVHNCERSDVFGFTAKWCEEKDKNGKIISWTYDVPIEHETFVIYEDDEPYCRGFVFRV